MRKVSLMADSSSLILVGLILKFENTNKGVDEANMYSFFWFLFFLSYINRRNVYASFRHYGFGSEGDFVRYSCEYKCLGCVDCLPGMGFSGAYEMYT